MTDPFICFDLIDFEQATVFLEVRADSRYLWFVQR